MIFLNSASSAAALVFDIPLCTHTDKEGKPREARDRNIFQNLLKNTINEHPVFATVYKPCTPGYKLFNTEFRQIVRTKKVSYNGRPATQIYPSIILKSYPARKRRLANDTKRKLAIDDRRTK